MFKILSLPGDGIGSEVMAEALKVLKVIEGKSDSEFEIIEGLIGGAAIDETGEPLPAETIKQLKEVDAVLLAAIGGSKWDHLPNDQKPEKGLLRLRKELKAFANLRPAKVFSSLVDSSSLKKEFIEGVDLMVVRELTGGIYFGEPRGGTSSDTTINTMSYADHEIARVTHCAAQIAGKRQKRICSVDKANVLEVSQRWRQVVTEIIEAEYKDIELSHLYVDNAAMQLVRAPRQFDVILTSNLFGDILSDQASMLTGSIGLLPSASFGDGSHPGLYEPVHGSAPDIAKQQKANPLATILSLAMLLEYSLNLSKESAMIRDSVEAVLKAGYRTADIGGDISTSEMGDLVCQYL